MNLTKVLMIIPQNTAGGAERVMCQLANNFVQRGIKVTLVNFDTETAFYDISPKVSWVKMGLEFKTQRKLGKFFEAPVKEIKRFICIKRIIKEEQPDIVIPFLEMAEVLTIPNCLLSKTPFCVSVRNDYNMYFKYMKLLSRLTYPKANLVVCQTKTVRDTLLKTVKCKTAVISNPLDKASYVENSIIKTRRKVIINVGRLTAQKNQEMLIRAFSLIAKDFPDYELHIFGKGELKEYLNNLIINLGLEKQVFLKGIVSNALAVNCDATVFVMSSDFEGFPNTLVEAMANGIPVISTDFNTRAAKELLKDGEYGWLVSIGDEKEMAAALIDVLKNPELAEQKAQKSKYIRDELDTNKICNQWIEEIEKSFE